MKEELGVPWNCSESHLHSVSSPNPYAQVEKGVRAAFRSLEMETCKSESAPRVIWDKTSARCFCDLCLLTSGFLL